MAEADARDGGVKADVIAPPPGELFSETNDDSVAILLSPTARPASSWPVTPRREYVANSSYTRP
jgi:hypothetical protein